MKPLEIPFGATSTAAQVIAGVDLHGKRAIVTGGSSGIGIETARTLAHAGAEVTLAVRDLDAGAKVARDIGMDRMNVATLDLSDRASIAAFVAAWRGPLHILILNAGVMATPERRTADGWELQLATNHLGHFALALGLRDALKESGGSRVVVVSSVGHVNADVQFDDLMFERRPYDRWQAYGQSKTANVLFMVEAARRWGADGITVNALNPGRIASTNLGRYMDAPPASFEPNSKDVTYKNVEQGAATSVLLAASPLVEGFTGTYFEDCQPAKPHEPGVRRGVASYALDPERAAKLWDISLALIGARASILVQKSLSPASAATTRRSTSAGRSSIDWPYEVICTSQDIGDTGGAYRTSYMSPLAWSFGVRSTGIPPTPVLCKVASVGMGNRGDIHRVTDG